MHLGAEASAGGDRPRLVRELDMLRAMGVRHVRALASSEGPDSESWFARERKLSLMSTLYDIINLGQRPTPWRVLPSMMPSPGRYNDGVVRGLDFLLHELNKRDMTVTLMLG